MCWVCWDLSSGCEAHKAALCSNTYCSKHNNLPFAVAGTQEERGLLAWKQSHEGGTESSQLVSKVYDLPFGIGTKYCNVSWFHYLPACPKRLSPDKRMDELKAVGQKNSVKASLERNSEIGADTRI